MTVAMSGLGDVGPAAPRRRGEMGADTSPAGWIRSMDPVQAARVVTCRCLAEGLLVEGCI